MRSFTLAYYMKLIPTEEKGLGYTSRPAVPYRTCTSPSQLQAFQKRFGNTIKNERETMHPVQQTTLLRCSKTKPTWELGCSEQHVQAPGKPHFTELLSYWRAVLEHSYFTEPEATHIWFERSACSSNAHPQAELQTSGWHCASSQPASPILSPALWHIGFIPFCWGVLDFSTYFSIKLAKAQQVKHHGDRKQWPKLQQIITRLEKKHALPRMCSFEEAWCSWCLPSNKAVCMGIIMSQAFLAHFHLRFWEYY